MDYFTIHKTEATEACDIIQVAFQRGISQLNPILEQKITAIGDEMQHRSNVKADMTDFFMHNDPDFKQVCDFAILQAINSVEGLSPAASQSMIFKIVDCWGMVYKNKSNHQSIEHAHWPSTFSFVYYVNACENCAPLQFKTANYEVKPFSGLLVLFPGHVSHCVPVQDCDHDRVAISGNISVRIREAGDTE